MSTPSSTKWTVTPVSSTPASSAWPIASRPGEGRQQGGVDVDDAVAEAGDEGRAEQLHVAGEDDQVGAARLDPVAHRRVARRAGRRTRRAGKTAVSTPAARARSSARAPGLSEPTPTTSIPSRPCSRVEDRLQVGAAAGGEDDDAESLTRASLRSLQADDERMTVP